MSIWYRVGTRAEIEAAGGIRVRVGERWLAVHVWQGKIYAVDDPCPHRGESLAQGIVGQDGYVICPGHGWEYSLETGCALAEGNGRVDVYEVEEREGGVWIRGADNLSGGDP